MILADERITALFEMVDTIVNMILVIVDIYAITGLISLIALWILFKKAGEPGYTAIIPIYNVFKMSKIATGKYTTAVIITILFSCFALPYLLTAIMILINNIIDISAFGWLAFLLLSSLKMGFLCQLATIVAFCYLSYCFTKSYGARADVCRLSIFFAPMIFIIIGFRKKTQYIGPYGKQLSS